MDYYGVELSEALRPGVYDPDKLWALAGLLPMESRTITAINRYPHRWGVRDYILADLIDATNQTTRAAMQTKKPPKIPRYNRPKPKREKPISVAEFTKRMGWHAS